MQDVLPLLNGNCEFNTTDGQSHCIDGRWDLIIAHPPCTYLTVAGNKYFNVERYGEKAAERIRLREEAIEFFMQFVNADCDKIAVENPVGVISTVYRKPDCIISPHQFGHPVSKKTCFWLKGLSPLVPTNIVSYEKDEYGCSGPARYVRDENGKILAWGDPRTAKARSRTYEGVAQAMVAQWAGKA